MSEKVNSPPSSTFINTISEPNQRLAGRLTRLKFSWFFSVPADEWQDSN